MNTAGGTQFGLARRATILSVDKTKGTCVIGIDELKTVGPPQTHQVAFPAAWFDFNGGFLGGIPIKGNSCLVKQVPGGEWFIETILPSTNTFSSNKYDLLDDGLHFQINQLLFGQINSTTNEIKLGNYQYNWNFDLKNSLTLQNTSQSISLSASSRKIEGLIKRDVIQNTLTGITLSKLTSPQYDGVLQIVAMDPFSKTSNFTIGPNVRNLPLSESRKVYYEFPEEGNFATDDIEKLSYQNNKFNNTILYNSRKESRADSFSLNLFYPNHLIETIVGTGVDAFGNILDINRSILPFKNISFSKTNINKSDAFSLIRNLHRKSIVYHWELNSRKDLFPALTSTSNYSRDQSNLFIDVDKEGQIKVNVPASSETGNISLFTRFQNYSTLLSLQDKNVNPNQQIVSENHQDIFHQTITPSGISLLGDNFSPLLDRFTGNTITYNTIFHDITKICQQFSTTRTQNINYDPTNLINQAPNYQSFLSSTLQLSGPSANAGGRSLSISLDGSFTGNIGCNTSDRQSIWLDCAGSVVTSFGRDKNGVSLLSQMDGDVILQIGGQSLPNSLDNRFVNSFDGLKAGKLEIRLIKEDGQMTVIKFDGGNIEVACPGRIAFMADQDISFKSNGNLLLDAENIILYPSLNGTARYLNRSGSKSL